MQLGNVAFKGNCIPLLIPKEGLYPSVKDKFLTNKLPDDISLKHVVRSYAKELGLRARLVGKGAFRGIKGEGIGFIGRLYATHYHNGKRTNLGLISTKVVTTAGVNYMRDDFNNNTGSADITNFKYHDAGTGVAAEAIGDTTLGTPYGGSRATGSQSGAVAKQYVTVGTISFTSTLAITEHGIFSATSSGTLWDRSVFSAINVVNGDSIQFTYTLALSDGG
jgi:hypothetical protein